MKRLLLPLLAALALPTAVNAESHWLILTYGWKGYYGAMEMYMEKMAMIRSSPIWNLLSGEAMGVILLDFLRTP